MERRENIVVVYSQKMAPAIDRREQKRKLLLVTTLSLVLAHHSRRRARKRSCWVRSWLERRQTFGMSYCLVEELRIEDEAEFQAMFHMDVHTFNELLCMVAPKITADETHASFLSLLRSSDYEFVPSIITSYVPLAVSRCKWEGLSSI